jgi:hypothetical protein
MVGTSGIGVTKTSEKWPELHLAEWEPTRATLHMWMQIVGKISLKLKPKVNHFWETALHFNARGLTTNAMPYGDRTLEIAFDLVNHHLVITSNDGVETRLPLITQSVADFYRDLMAQLHTLGFDIHIWTMPVEIPDPIAFDQDETHHTYERAHVAKFWEILRTIEPIMAEFRGRFVGKCSPVHFFWGSFDLAVTRFSGRRAPERPGADPITREAYSHEVISHGWWPGGGPVKDSAFYAYAAPEPVGFKLATVRPEKAFYSKDLNEFLLMYDDVRTADDPQQALMDFMESTYETGATLAKWDREELEVGTRERKAS